MQVIEKIRLTLRRRVFCTLLLAFFCGSMVTACNGVSLFKLSAGTPPASSEQPPPAEEVIPPVPVTGSYLTSILVNENDTPLAGADITIVEGLIRARTNAQGQFEVPVSAVREKFIDLDVTLENRTFSSRLYLPKDLLEAISLAQSTSLQKVERNLLIRLRSDASPVPSGTDSRLPLETISLPSTGLQAAGQINPLLQLKITSHKNGDRALPVDIVSGECTSGYLVRVMGEISLLNEITCTDVAGRGSFSAPVTLEKADGMNNLSIEHVDTQTNSYISQSLVLESSALSLKTNAIQGLVGKIDGNCDSSDGITTLLTSDVGTIVEQSCRANVFTAQLHLAQGPAGGINLKLSSVNASTGLQKEVNKVVSRTAFVCPAGYVGVPRSGLNGLGNIRAVKGHASWWLDADKDFCVMKYPAKDNNGSTYATSTGPGLPWVNLPRGADESVVGGALKACKDVPSGNYRLMSNTQYMTIARNAEKVAANWSGGAAGLGVLVRGFTNPIHPNQNLDNNAPDSNPYYGTGKSAANAVGAGWEQRRTHVLSNGEVVWDISGNVLQWVSDDYSSLGVDPEIVVDPNDTVTHGWLEYSSAALSTPINRLLFGPSGPLTSAQYAGKMKGGNAGAVMRGGQWDNWQGGSGLFGALLGNNADTSMWTSIGFRCVHLPAE